MKQILKTLPAFLILILGICLSFWIYSINKKAKFKEKENQISAVIENSYRDIQKELAVSFSSVEILRSIFEEQENISKEEFKNFTASLLKSNPGIKALSWVPKITNEERTAFENKISKTLNDKVVITKRNNQNEAIANEENSFYFPVTFIEPFNENKKALGYNIYSDSSRQKTIDLAINKGKIVITPRILLVQDTARYGFLGISVVYYAPNSPKTIENVKGLISTVFEFDLLINDALTSTKDSKIAIVIFDITNNKKELIYGNKVLFGKTNQYTRKKTLAVGGRIWELNFIITPGYYQIANIKAYLIGGIAISFLLFMLLLVPVIKERRRIILFEKLFKEQKLRVHVQESLSESEEKYRYMFANNPEPMWIYDLETLAFLEINNAAINHYGYSREEFLSMTIKDIRPKEDLDAFFKNINQTGQPLNFAGEWRHLKKNGEIITVEITSHLITFNGHKARHVMVNDITTRKQTEENLRLSNQTIQNIIDNASSLIYLFNLNGEFLLANKNFERLLGFSPGELVGHTRDEFFPKEIAELHRNNDLGVINSKKPIIFEEENLESDGKHFYLTSKFPLFNAEGNIYAVGGISTDITESKQREKAIIESYERNELISKATNDALWDWNLNTNIVWWNFGVTELFGHILENNEATPNWWLEKIHPDEREKVEKFFFELVNGKELFWEDEYRFRCNDGTYSNVYDRGTVKRDENGKALRMVGAMVDITERKLAEAALKESEEKFRNAVMNAPFPIMIHSEKGEVVLINDTWQEISGYSHQEIPTIEKWTQLAYGEKIEVVKEEINLLYEIDKRKDEGEYEIATKNGQKRIWAFSSAPIGHDSEKNRLVISMAIDITKRKKAEENLKKSEENLRLSTELANVAVWEYDFSTNTMERSKNHDHLYGLPPQAVWEMGTFVKATHPLDREISSGFIQKSVASGGPDKYTFDFRVVFPDKSTHWLNVIGQVMERNSKGEGVIVRGTLMDITERKKVEDELKRNEQILKLFVKYSPAAIAMFDKEMKYIVVSNRFKLDYELGEKNIIGHSHYEIFPELKVEWKALHKRCLAGEILKADEEQFVQNNGSIGWLRWEIHPWYDKEGEIGGLILFSEVITDRKKAQEEIKILNAELEQRVIDRTAQLDAANKELQTFTYSVSHDLKAPLRGIDGYSKLLEELYAKDLNEEAKYFVKTIRNGTKQMNRLIEDLLDYSRLERATLRMESIKIKKFINTIIDSFEVDASSKKTLFNIKIPDIEIIADSKGLSIALRNITENAIKFSAKNKNPKIEISLIEEPKFWLISMKDNGIGFDMKYKDRIFEIFQQLNLPEEFPGTGIGLAMSHKSMEKMGGKIWAESTVGNGATFYLQIPKIKI